MLRLGRGAPLRHGLRPNAAVAYQPSDAMLANAVPLFNQGVSDPWTAEYFPRLLVDHSNG